jgi:hypothetical protein
MVEAEDIIRRGWIKVEALRLSKLAVKQEIRDLGLKLSEFSAKEITLRAEKWFGEHRAELIGQATIGLLFARMSVRNHPKLRTLPAPQASKAKEFSR